MLYQSLQNKQTKQSAQIKLRIMTAQTPSNEADLPILIIGAGVAGLVIAQGLRKHNIPFSLFERQPRAQPAQGHRFRISAEALDGLLSTALPETEGLLRRTAAKRNPAMPLLLDAHAFDIAAPDAPRLHGDGVYRGSAPIDRSWVRVVLKNGIEDAVHYDKTFVSYEIARKEEEEEEEGAKIVTVRFADGSSARGRFLIGADGIRSGVRRQLQPERRLLDVERWSMWGRTPLTADLRSRIPPQMLDYFIAEDRAAQVTMFMEAVVWPDDKEAILAALPGFQFSDYLYWAFTVPPGAAAPSIPQTERERRDFMARLTAGFHPALRTVFDEASYDVSACLPLMSSAPEIGVRGADRAGRVTLVGDAAHAMSPMGGSGGDTAILSAVDLVRTLISEGVTSEGIAEFESRMEERARVKLTWSFKMHKEYSAGKDWTEYGPAEV